MKFLHALLLFALPFHISSANEISFYIGTFTDNPKSKGIYLGHLDTDTGKLGPLTLASEAKNPNFWLSPLIVNFSMPPWKAMKKYRGRLCRAIRRHATLEHTESKSLGRRRSMPCFNRWNGTLSFRREL